jgi:hypothetical protein
MQSMKAPVMMAPRREKADFLDNMSILFYAMKTVFDIIAFARDRPLRTRDALGSNIHANIRILFDIS